MDMRIVFVLALGLAGCTITGETVFLENAAGNRVQCGPYSVTTRGGQEVADRQVSFLQLRSCVEDFQI